MNRLMPVPRVLAGLTVAIGSLGFWPGSPPWTMVDWFLVAIMAEGVLISLFWALNLWPVSWIRERASNQGGPR